MNEKQLELLKQIVNVFGLRGECVNVNLTSAIDAADKKLLELCHGVYVASFDNPASVPRRA